MPTSRDIEETIVRAICKTIPADRSLLTPETRFDSLGASSLEIVCILFEIEDEYDVNVARHAPEQLQTIGAARDLVLALLASEPASETASEAAS